MAVIGMEKEPKSREGMAVAFRVLFAPKNPIKKIKHNLIKHSFQHPF
ncbi:hypothetical protein HPNQ4053_0995 [Helicobacter pylori NQ4053]|uniref:Uncharacterized protein n=1 Tax=Helicobacter pylori NQ4053 TaxID=992027 RepID=I9QH89_HELPX|nr:hypothetical protein HPNQ4053_0995 [Helicobacter pylori NQ4053]